MKLEAHITASYLALYQHLKGLGLSPQGRYPSVLPLEKSILLSKYCLLLERWSKKVDLVAPAKLAVLVERHIIDSLAAGMLLPVSLAEDSSLALLDIGSGAGLPGVVLAVLEPDRPVILCEPREKRVMFLKELKRELALPNLSIVKARMEDLAKEALPILGCVICRALGHESEFLRAAGSLIDADGILIQMLGPSWQATELRKEVDTSTRLKLDSVIDYTLSQGGPERKLALWKCFT